MLNQLIIGGEIVGIKDGTLTIRNHEEDEIFKFNLTPRSFSKVNTTLSIGDIIAIKGKLHSNERNEFSVSIEKMFGLTKDGLDQFKTKNENVR